MLNTFQNSASVLSIGVFFTIITLGLAATLPGRAVAASPPRACPRRRRTRSPDCRRSGSLFAAFLGFNPIQQLLPVGGRGARVGAQYAYLTGRGFFPNLIADRSATACTWPSCMAAVLCFVAAVFSWLRGRGAADARCTGRCSPRPRRGSPEPARPPCRRPGRAHPAP